MSEPIFQSVGAALSFSFYMENIEGSPISTTLAAIKSLMKNSGRVFERAESKIKMGGLSRLEVHGQCALVLAAVKDHLTEPEKNVMWVRYGYGMTKYYGIKGLSTYVESRTTNKGVCLEAIVYSICGKDDSIRAIADMYEVSVHSIRNDMSIIKSILWALNDVAEGRLKPLFEKSNLIYDEKNYISA